MLSPHPASSFGFQISRLLQYCTSGNRLSTIWNSSSIALDRGKGIVIDCASGRWDKNHTWHIWRYMNTLFYPHQVFYVQPIGFLFFFVSGDQSPKSHSTVSKFQVTFCLPLTIREIFWDWEIRFNCIALHLPWSIEHSPSIHFRMGIRLHPKAFYLVHPYRPQQLSQCHSVGSFAL
jgi:hypothetical protein